ncbi:DUF4190 domain-containing protein [Amycolatopsis nigrescens]|uniref:DUF4190 domain-containing protein n=1 Tax=Amycolatopsis nigrescens TaxID=381445 RepID=UPI000378B341|nr:DUF4190 domain-containing protein [Amycolatopsis nigrescens]
MADPEHPYEYSTSAPVPATASGKRDADLAVVALICSCTGILFCGLSTVIGIVLGHVAYRRAGRGEVDGRGMALAAIIVGYTIVALWLSLLAVVLILLSGRN